MKIINKNILEQSAVVGATETELHETELHETELHETELHETEVHSIDDAQKESTNIETNKNENIKNADEVSLSRIKQIRHIMREYKNTMQIVQQKKESLVRCLSCPALSVMQGYKKFCDTEDEIDSLNEKYLAVSEVLQNLSEGDKMILTEIMRGYTNHDIAKNLGISYRKVNIFLDRFLKKLRCHVK